MVKKLLESVKNTLFSDPKLLYEEERQFINEPFYFKGTNGKGIVLIHGWTSTPYEIRRLGKYLNENGYTVLGPMLKGHGTVPQDLEKITWDDWMQDVRNAFARLKDECSEVFIAGTSIGSNLAVIFAAERKDVAGLVLMATPFHIKFEKMTIAFAKLLRKFKKYNKKIYPPTFGASTTITRVISYQTYSIDSALETFKLVERSRGDLEKVTQPCFILQSASDHVVARNSLEKIYAGIGSEIKKRKYIQRAYHTFISDIKNEHVFEDILEFLNSL